MELKGDGYVPLCKMADIADDLHEKFNFRTDTQIVDESTKKIKQTKK